MEAINIEKPPNCKTKVHTVGPRCPLGPGLPCNPCRDKFTEIILANTVFVRQSCFFFLLKWGQSATPLGLNVILSLSIYFAFQFTESCSLIKLIIFLSSLGLIAKRAKFASESDSVIGIRTF